MSDSRKRVGILVKVLCSDSIYSFALIIIHRVQDDPVRFCLVYRFISYLAGDLFRSVCGVIG